MFGISRQAIYKRQQVALATTKTRNKVKQLVIDQRIEMPRIGTRKLYYLLGEQFRIQGIKVGRDKLFDFLRHEHMLIHPRKNYVKTTWSKHWLHKHPNLIKGLQVTSPEQLWVSDITYIKTKHENCYLSLVTDAFSRKIMGYHVSNDMKAESVGMALQMALSSRIYKTEIIHHSDRGLQYCSQPYQQIISENGMTCSMTDGYDCYQNALAERINGILKEEFLFPLTENIDQLSTMVKQSINIYNCKRPHLALQMNVPEQVHKQNSP